VPIATYSGFDSDPKICNRNLSYVDKHELTLHVRGSQKKTTFYRKKYSNGHKYLRTKEEIQDEVSKWNKYYNKYAKEYATAFVRDADDGGWGYFPEIKGEVCSSRLSDKDMFHLLKAQALFVKQGWSHVDLIDAHRRDDGKLVWRGNAGNVVIGDSTYFPIDFKYSSETENYYESTIGVKKLVDEIESLDLEEIQARPEETYFLKFESIPAIPAFLEATSYIIMEEKEELNRLLDKYFRVREPNQLE